MKIPNESEFPGWELCPGGAILITGATFKYKNHAQTPKIDHQMFTFILKSPFSIVLKKKLQKSPRSSGLPKSSKI